MKQKQLIINALFLLVCGIIESIAQNVSVPSGGNVSGSTGNVSYTIGQVFYITVISDSGSVAQGVQNPYEIFNISGIDDANIISDISVYPIPTGNQLILDIKRFDFANFFYYLYDNIGTLLKSEEISSNKTKINMSSFKSATYYIKITTDDNEFRTFKIIKN